MRSFALLRKEEGGPPSGGGRSYHPILRSKKGGGKEHDRRRWRIQGVWVGVAVKIVSDEQERPTILGTARGLNIA